MLKRNSLSYYNVYARIAYTYIPIVYDVVYLYKIAYKVNIHTYVFMYTIQ